MANKKKAGREWCGGIISMSVYVSGEGEPYRPEALLWLDSELAVIGTTLGTPGELLTLAAQSLKDAISQPLHGNPHTPARVRVASEELAAVLRSSHPSIEIICAPTPEVDEVAALMREELGEHEELASYLAPGISPALVSSFFKATAQLHRAKPWALFPGDQSVVSVTIERMNVREAVVSIVGQMGQHFGFVFFKSLADHDAFADGALALEEGKPPKGPQHLALNFEPASEVPTELRAEVAQHGWELAATDAYPWLMSVDTDLVPRPAGPEELILAEAISLALPVLLAERSALEAAWAGSTEPVSRTFSVNTYDGPVEVTLRAPFEKVVLRPPFDILADLFELTRDGQPPDPRAVAELEDELVERFEGSPEAEPLTELGNLEVLMDFASEYFGATVATLKPAELREIVFGIFPRKLSIQPSAARGIIDELRAFYAFLKREFGFQPADKCLRVLEGDAVTELEAALSNSGNFGMAKSLLMAGAEAGFDMRTKQGIDAWMREVSSKPLPASFRLPGFAAPDRTAERHAERAQKKQKKAARKARKRNR